MQEANLARRIHSIVPKYNCGTVSWAFVIAKPITLF
jgi:hypothetical protein